MKQKRRVNNERKKLPRKWSIEEDNQLILMSESLPDKEIAQILDRTIYSIHNRRYVLREMGIES